MFILLPETEKAKKNMMYKKSDSWLLERLKNRRIIQLYANISASNPLIKKVEIYCWNKFGAKLLSIIYLLINKAKSSFSRADKGISKIIYNPVKINFNKRKDLGSIYPNAAYKTNDERINYLGGCMILKEANAYGKTNLHFTKDKCYYHELLDINKDLLSEELHAKLIVIRRPFRELIIKTGLAEIDNYKPIILEEAAPFTDACSSNYAHFMTEVLPRISFFCRQIEFRNIPIIVDHGIHSNLYKAIEYIAQDRTIYLIKETQSVFIQKAIITPKFGYVPWGTHRNNASTPRHGIFNTNELSETRNLLLNNPTMYDNSIISSKKLYIPRFSTTRVLINQKEVIKTLEKENFIVYDPCHHTLENQIRTFEQASIIVAETGAGITNAIFCREGTRLIVLMGTHKNMIYNYWSNMLNGLDINVTVLRCQIKDSRSLGIHGNYLADLEKLKELTAT